MSIFQWLQIVVYCCGTLQTMKVLSISYGKNFFNPHNDERGRMLTCANEAGELHVVVFSHHSERLESETVADNFHLYPTNSSGSVGKIKDAIALGKKIITGNPSDDWVITAQDPFAAGLVAWRISKATGVPFNIQEHGDFFSTPHWRRETLLNQIWYQIGKFLLRRADSVRVVAERVKETVKDLGVRTDKIHILSVRTDVTRFQNAQPDQKCIPDFDPQKIYILTTARFVPQKNLPMLVRAFAAVHQVHQHTHLLMVGKGKEEVLLKVLVERLNLSGAVTFIEWSENVPALMKTAHVYALSSNYEGWGRVLIEAEAAGMPIVTTDVGCVGERVVSNEWCVVAPVGDEKCFTDALMIVIKRIESGSDKGSIGATKKSAFTEGEYARTWTDILQKTLVHKV